MINSSNFIIYYVIIPASFINNLQLQSSFFDRHVADYS